MCVCVCCIKRPENVVQVGEVGHWTNGLTLLPVVCLVIYAIGLVYNGQRILTLAAERDSRVGFHGNVRQQILPTPSS